MTDAPNRPLSPAAQAVLDAFREELDCGDDWDWENLAAALCAVADQVAPLSGRLGKGYRQHRSAKAERLAIRRELLAIAAELKTQP